MNPHAVEAREDQTATKNLEPHILSRPTVDQEHGLVRQLAALRPGDHLCMIYDDPEQQMRAAVPFIQQGLRQGERCVYIADVDRIEDTVDVLRAAGVDVTRHEQEGGLIVCTHREMYLRDGIFEPEDMIEFMRESVEEAVARGFTGFRVTGEMTWALGTESPCRGLIEYEAMLNRFFPGRPALALCQYDRKRFPAHVVRDVLRTHPMAVLGDQVCSNLYYEPPEFVLEGGHEEERVDWMISQLQRWHYLSVSRDALQREVKEREHFESQLKETAAALERSNHELEHFAYIASHDLQEPLRTIAGYAQLLGRRYGDQLGEEGARYIERTVSGTQRMQRLINDLLDYSRVQSRGGDFETIDVAYLMQDVLKDLKRLIKERRAKIQVDKLPSLPADPSQLRQVLANLIINAMKYCPEDRNPRIQVTCQETPAHWTLQISDNGTGIPPDQYGRIFVPFQRLVPRTSGDTGTGMGLAITRRIIERHHGRIWVESIEGEGSVFYIELPKEVQ